MNEPLNFHIFTCSFSIIFQLIMFLYYLLKQPFFLTDLTFRVKFSSRSLLTSAGHGDVEPVISSWEGESLNESLSQLF